MSQSTITTAVDRSTPAAAPMSRRVLLAAGAGLAGAAAAASSATPADAQSQAQAPAATPQMPAVQAPVRTDWLTKRTEEILEPGLPIIDPHHHLWDAPRYRYMFPELLADLASGHNIVATMYEQAREMYRADGPEELKSLGETEFITGVAAMAPRANTARTCIAAFGSQRSMFESNFPVDKGTCSYPVLWNAFKRLAAGYSPDEKSALFNGAAKKVYRLEV